MKCLSILLFALLLSAASFAQELSGADQFSKGTVWFNCEWPMNVEMFREKILVIAIWHPECIEARSRVLQMQDDLFNTPQIQLLSLFPGDSLHPVSRSEINGVIQEYQLTHPIGITPDFKGFQDVDVSRLPVFLLYQQSIRPTLVSNDGSSPGEFSETVKNLAADKAFLRGLSGWQVVPTIEPKYWADPLVEYPTYVSSTADGYPLYVSEPAHNRIVVLDENGVAEHIIGGQRGQKEGNFMSTQFTFPSGTSFDPMENLLYISDTDNHRVKVADLGGKIVYNLIGTGKEQTDRKLIIDGAMEAISFPTDVEFFDKKLYVLSGGTNQLFEADPVSGKCQEIARFADHYWLNGRVRAYAKNLSISKAGIYITMSDGMVYHWFKKKLVKVHQPASDYDRVSAVAFRNKALYLLFRDGRYIEVKGKKANKRLTGTGEKGWQNGPADQVTFNDPTDLCVAAGDLVVCDHGNHLLRFVNPATGKTNVMRIRPEQDLVYSTDALNGGDPVIYDSLFVASGNNKLHIQLDLGDYVLVKEGRNQVFVNEMEGPAIESNDLTETGIQCTFDTKKLPSPLLQFEMYMCVASKSNPNLILMKRTFLNVLIHELPDAVRDHEIDYAPRLLPY
jgi:hypothetical protein